MSTVGVDGSSLLADLQPMSVGLVCELVATCCRVCFIAWTEWTLVVTVPCRQCYVTTVWDRCAIVLCWGIHWSQCTPNIVICIIIL